VPFAWEFADPEAFARALASTGPAYEAIQAVGEDAFRDHCIELASERVRDGLPLRAVILVTGYVARKRAPSSSTSGAGFLALPETTDDVQRLYDEDVADRGYVMNVSRVWGQLPEAKRTLFELLGQTARAGSLSVRQRGILIAACASALEDSYCSLAWGTKLAGEADAETAAEVLHGEDGRLDPAERALARWARHVTRNPNSTTAADVQALRDAGFDDRQIFAITTFVAVRLAFSTVNDALGAMPDVELLDTVPPAVRDAVTYGRPPAER
jgi:uncharacterized peroxidase-related enzyme